MTILTSTSPINVASNELKIKTFEQDEISDLTKSVGSLKMTTTEKVIKDLTVEVKPPVKNAWANRLNYVSKPVNQQIAEKIEQKKAEQVFAFPSDAIASLSTSASQVDFFYDKVVKEYKPVYVELNARDIEGMRYSQDSISSFTRDGKHINDVKDEILTKGVKLGADDYEFNVMPDDKNTSLSNRRTMILQEVVKISRSFTMKALKYHHKVKAYARVQAVKKQCKEMVGFRWEEKVPEDPKIEKNSIGEFAYLRINCLGEIPPDNKYGYKKLHRIRKPYIQKS